MIKPIHIFLLTLILFALTLNFYSIRSVLNEIYTLLLCLSLFDRPKLNKINTISIYGLITLNVVNLAALFFEIDMTLTSGYWWYCLAYGIVYASFLSIIFTLKINERIN